MWPHYRISVGVQETISWPAAQLISVSYVPSIGALRHPFCPCGRKKRCIVGLEGAKVCSIVHCARALLVLTGKVHQ